MCPSTGATLVRATSGLVQLVSKLQGQVVGPALSLWLLLPGTPRELMEDMMTAAELGKPGWGWSGRVPTRPQGATDVSLLLGRGLRAWG